MFPLNARYVSPNINSLRYEVSASGFMGQGVTRISGRSEMRLQNECLVKVIPWFFDPASFDPYSLAHADGNYAQMDCYFVA